MKPSTSTLALVNGQPSACVSLFDRGLAYGDGLFETLRIHAGKPVLAGLHWDRLQLGLERLAMRLYQIPDIRLFWSTDTGFLNQFRNKGPRDPVVFKVSCFFQGLWRSGRTDPSCSKCCGFQSCEVLLCFLIFSSFLDLSLNLVSFSRSRKEMKQLIFHKKMPCSRRTDLNVIGISEELF